MKKNYTILLVFLLAILGCEKQDFLLLSNDLTLKEIRVELQAQDVLRRASFTTEGKIRNVILGLLSTSEFDDMKREYIYTPDNLLECVPGISSFDAPGCYPYLEYSNGLLTTLNGNALEYDGNRITELNFLHDSRIIYEFEDASYTKLLKVDFIKDVSTTPVLYIQELFEYQDNNLTRIEANRLDDTTGQFGLAFLTEYTYDDKRNPYQQGHNQIALVSYYQQMLYLGSNQHNLVFRSSNNVITRSYTNLLSGFQSTLSYTYEYNAMGYPIERVHTISVGDVVKKYSYYE